MKFTSKLIITAISVTFAQGSAFADEAAPAHLAVMLKLYQRPNDIPYPKDNAHSAARETLGKNLYFDPRLSGKKTLSCASCHNPSLGWGDGLPKGIGHDMQTLGRRSPTILNLAWGALMFWDGRSESLEEQALGPIESKGEMNLPLPEAVARLKSIKGYAPLFEKAYPGEGITTKTIGKAIATFERTVVSSVAPFDKWVQGDQKALSASAKRGFVLFNTKANCASCHSGWRFTDDSFHDIGLASEDKGRGELLKDIEVLQHAFKTPGLRNITKRAPYMHDGSEASLEDVVALYNNGGRVQRPSLAAEVFPLNLSPEQQTDLVEFMKSLTSQDKPVSLPELPQ